MVILREPGERCSTMPRKTQETGFVEIPGSGKVKFYANKHVGVEVRRVPTQARDQNDPLPAPRLCDIARKKYTASRAVGPGPGTM